MRSVTFAPELSSLVCRDGLQSGLMGCHDPRPRSVLLSAWVALAAASAVPKAPAPVLAYLFTLRRARHPLPHAWTDYFAGCAPGSYKIVIHVDPTFNATTAGESGPAAKYFRQSNVLPRDQLIKVRRFGHELVQARMRLLRYATHPSDGAPAPLWYSFFSESCAPISTCEAAHAYLSAPEHANKSFIYNKRPMPPQQASHRAVATAPQPRAEPPAQRADSPCVRPCRSRTTPSGCVSSNRLAHGARPPVWAPSTFATLLAG